MSLTNTLAGFFYFVTGGYPFQFLLEVTVIFISLILIFINQIDTKHQAKPEQTLILKIVGIYAFFGGLWIYLSDELIGLFIHDPSIITSLSILKGTIFIILTSLLLYFLLKKYLKTYHISQKALLESEARFRFLVEQAPEAILIYSIKLDHFTDANLQAEKLLGLPRDKIFLLNFQKTYSTGPNQPTSDSDFKIHLHKVLSGETVIYERYLHNSQGQDIFCEVRMVLLPSLDQDLIRASFIDITERQKAQARIIELDKLKNNFIKIISHQLRTPLTIIRWSLDAILSGENGTLKKGQDGILRVAAKADAQIISRLNDLLTVMDIEEKRIIISKEEVQLESLLTSVVKSFDPEIKIKNLKLKFLLPKTPLPSIQADPIRLRDAFIKLIDNAITYTPENGKITIKLFSADNYIHFEVTDTGIGIPSKEQSLIFQYFHRASNAYVMKQDASGVSLNITKHFVEAHHGQIGFSSLEGKGSTFWFTLPQSEASPVQLNP